MDLLEFKQWSGRNWLAGSAVMLGLFLSSVIYNGLTPGRFPPLAIGLWVAGILVALWTGRELGRYEAWLKQNKKELTLE